MNPLIILLAIIYPFFLNNFLNILDQLYNYINILLSSIFFVLGVDYSSSRLRKHSVIFMRYSDLNNREDCQGNNILDVYFLRHPSKYNASGYLELLNKAQHKIGLFLFICMFIRHQLDYSGLSLSRTHNV